jgi:BirA family biotin operon repressor/biotin-[acetyl-CoA-carboxylase] ligase
MDFKKSAAVANRFLFLETTGSTNADLVELANSEPNSYPNFSVLVAGSQTAGRGRAGRQWVSPAGKSLAISVLLKPQWPIGQYGWLPLVAGVAMKRAVQSALPESEIQLKWPNDVLVENKKISGILSELIPTLNSVVVGAGINLTLETSELPIPQSTSLALEGWSQSPDDFLASYLGNFTTLINNFEAAQRLVREECTTIGLEVRAIFPDATEKIGTAIGIDDDGRLLISEQVSETLLAVSAGDVEHLRHN